MMEMLRAVFLFAWLLVLCSTTASVSQGVRRYTFIIERTTVTRLCAKRSIITVNGQYPAPTLDVNVGDRLAIKVINKSPYNATIHWHGIRQFCSPWADGPMYITQCPIQPGATYTYRFEINEREGTLWWHAHASWLRATVHGAIVIRHPKIPTRFKTHGEILLLLGEWWNRDPVKVLNEALQTGGVPVLSDALTINGQPGDFYPCSKPGTYRVPVLRGKKYMLRLINAAMNTELFFSVGGHKLTVINSDGNPVKPFTRTTAFVAPGQSLDLLLTTDQPIRNYYMAASVYASSTATPFNKGTTTAVLQYEPTMPFPAPLMPSLPPYNDTATVSYFTGSQHSLHAVNLPRHVDEHILFTIGLGVLPCDRPGGKACQGPNGTKLTASMNNNSFVLPNISVLQAYYYGIPGVFSADLPSTPPIEFDYTGTVNFPPGLQTPVRGTRVKALKYNRSVQVVFQDTNIVAAENHPMHLHGYDFYIVGAGFGNFDAKRDPPGFNLADPPRKNVVAVPVNGWAAIRFVADNPGVWFLHCHLDEHLPWGLSTAFLVKNGPDANTTLKPPPNDLPPC